MSILLLAILGCQEADPCAAMCSTATQHYGGCLDLWGLDWEASGYDDAEDFFGACETWAWATRQLEEDAGASGATSRECRARQGLIDAADFECADWGEIDWNALPW